MSGNCVFCEMIRFSWVERCHVLCHKPKALESVQVTALVAYTLRSISALGNTVEALHCSMPSSTAIHAEKQSTKWLASDIDGVSATLWSELNIYQNFDDSLQNGTVDSVTDFHRNQAIYNSAMKLMIEIIASSHAQRI